MQEKEVSQRCPDAVDKLRDQPPGEETGGEAAASGGLAAEAESVDTGLLAE
jgi:hypothetical protein